MNTKLFVAAAAGSLLLAGAADAATSRHTARTYAEPAQPIAYSKVSAYLKASPRQRETRDWTNGPAMAQANTGGAVNASATQPGPQAAEPSSQAGPMNAPNDTSAPPATGAPAQGAPSTAIPEQTAPAAQSPAPTSSAPAPSVGSGVAPQ